MSEIGSSFGRKSDESARRAAERALAMDLAALRTASARDLPTLNDTAQILATARLQPAPGGIFMSLFRRMKTRPWLATTLGTATVAAVLLFVPISYERTVGHDVTLSIAVPTLGGDQLKKIATEFKKAIGAESVAVTVEDDAGPVLKAKAPGRSRARIERVATAFAHGLGDRGIPAQSTVTARTERVLGNVYALASDNLIQINVDGRGKSAEEIEAEIRAQLEAAGVEFTTVDVEQEDGRTKVMLQQKVTAVDGEEPPAEPPNVQLTIDGLEPADPQDKRVEVKIHRTEGMTNEEVIADVKRQLQEQGIEAEVTIDGNGQIQIEEIEH